MKLGSFSANHSNAVSCCSGESFSMRQMTTYQIFDTMFCHDGFYPLFLMTVDKSCQTGLSPLNSKSLIDTQ